MEVDCLYLIIFFFGFFLRFSRYEGASNHKIVTNDFIVVMLSVAILSTHLSSGFINRFIKNATDSSQRESNRSF